VLLVAVLQHGVQRVLERLGQIELARRQHARPGHLLDCIRRRSSRRRLHPVRLLRERHKLAVARPPLDRLPDLAEEAADVRLVEHAHAFHEDAAQDLLKAQPVQRVQHLQQLHRWPQVRAVQLGPSAERVPARLALQVGDACEVLVLLECPLEEAMGLEQFTAQSSPRSSARRN
jgi:hypothetical protein